MAAQRARLWTPGSPKQTETPARSSSETMICAPVGMQNTLSGRKSRTGYRVPPIGRTTGRWSAGSPSSACSSCSPCTPCSCSVSSTRPRRVTSALYLAIEIGTVALVAARAIAVRRNRAGWALVALALALWTAGDLCWTLWLEKLEAAPFPSIADALYLGMYGVLYVALALLLRDRVRPFPAWLAIDGILAGLTLAAIAAGTVFVPVRDATEGSGVVVATTLAYLVCDLLMLVVVLVAFTATAWKPRRGLVAARRRPRGLRHRATASGSSRSPPAPTSPAAGSTWLWPAAFAAIGLAAWQRTGAARPRARRLGDRGRADRRVDRVDRHPPPRRAQRHGARSPWCSPPARCSPGSPARS